MRAFKFAAPVFNSISSPVFFAPLRLCVTSSSFFFASLRLCVTLLLFSSPAAADDKPEPKAEKITYRVVGLFSPDREKDLRAGFEELPDFKLVAVNFDDAEITVEFSPAKLWPGQKPERVTELVNDKVRAATSHTFGVKPRREVARDKLQQVVIPAAGLDCKACCLAAYEAVANVEGVYQATASFKEGRVTALFDPAKTDRAKLEDALRKKGVDLGKPKQ
jgi:copper chaperone CopZ